MLPLHWFLLHPCGLCGAPLPVAGPPAQAACPDCRSRLALNDQGLVGEHPIRWWAAGLYQGELRQLLLQLRHRPRAQAVGALASSLMGRLEAITASGQRPLLVPIPSWKRKANPLPGLLAEALARRPELARAELLSRAHPVLGQHHLGRALRLANQAGAFRCRRPPGAGEARRRPLVIVDDILTSGATVCSAAAALRQAGWRVHGAVCLARTPGSRPKTGAGAMAPENAAMESRGESVI